MSRTRLHIDRPLAANTELTLTGDPARYVGRVLRLGPDDTLTLFDGHGGEYPATILSLGKNDVTVSVGKHIDREVESPLAIHLLQGISRGDRMDFVVQKATELGVVRMTPVITDYSVVKLEEKRAQKRLHHWQGIVASACEQSGRNRLPGIDSPQPLRSWLGENLEAPGTRLILKPGEGNSINSLNGAARKIVLLIGPEGGFTPEEVLQATDYAATRISWPEGILRIETATVVFASLLMSQMHVEAK